jgi:hypothetical protein
MASSSNQSLDLLEFLHRYLEWISLTFQFHHYRCTHAAWEEERVMGGKERGN